MLEAILNILFPPKCPACRQYVEHNGHWCTECLGRLLTPRRLPLEAELADIFDGGVWCLGDYDEPLKKLIADMKFEKKKSAIKALQFFAQAGVEALDLHGTDLAVPVPLHPAKLKQRGFNQSLVLFQPAFLAKNIDFSDCLSRDRDTPHQYGLSQTQRRANLKGAFSLGESQRPLVQGRQILLADDIFTTGATFYECGKILKNAGAASIIGLVATSGRK